jgi:hypothetical protein
MYKTFINANADFTCKHCGWHITTQSMVSGVKHRNHCPICLYSRHMDLFQAGDRLCACKGMMAPVGLTLKRSTDKYHGNHAGELMLVHRCLDCGALSINRIAADDDPETLLMIFEHSLSGRTRLIEKDKMNDIDLLQDEDRLMLHSRLFGHVLDPVPVSVCA